MHTSLEYRDLREKLSRLNNDTSHFNNSNDVCTPMECVEEMVDTIPDELWERDKIEIFDPCAGNGNFPAYILQKIQHDFFLTINEISDIRKEYLGEFFIEDEKLEITQNDFLEDIFDKKYDLVIANPPYALFSNNKRAAKNHGVSKTFIKNGLDILKEDGYLVFIVPDNWMSRSDRNDVANRLSFYQFIYLNIHGAKQYFPRIGSSFTWFVLKKSENINSFIVDNNYKCKEISKTYLDKNIYSIPLFYNETVRSILNKTIYGSYDKIKIETSSDLHKYTKRELLSNIQDDKHPYELVHTPTQRVFSERPHKFQKGWKVFISLTSYYSTFIEKDVGATQSIGFIRVNNKHKALLLKYILDHPLYVFINNIHRYGNFNNIRILQDFPYPNDSNNIWESFDITKEEQKFIHYFLRS
jgi:SAM-dependent methyltransferase